ncbi:MAG: glycosyltransferase [Planctomycetota bacterium]
MSTPLVTVLMPAYNARRHVKRAVASVLAQTMRDLELLVYDDASTDGTREILRDFARRDQRVRLVEADKTGYSKLLARGVGEARGIYVARMDADDVSLPRRLALQIKALEADPRLGIVGGQALRVDAGGWPIRPWNVPTDHDEIDQLHMAGIAGQMIHPATTFRTEVLRELGYDPELEPAEDFDLWLRGAEVCRLGNVPEQVLRYRWHGGNVSTLRSRQGTEAVRRALENASQRRGVAVPSVSVAAPGTQTQWEAELVRQAFHHRHPLTALKHLVPLAARTPSDSQARDLFVGIGRRLLGAAPRPVREA